MAAKAELKGKLSINTSAFSRGLKAARKEAAQFGKDVTNFVANTAVTGMKALTVATIGAGVALAYGTKQAYDLGSAMQDASDKTGIAIDQLQILQEAAKDNGIEDITGAIGKMQKNLVEAVAKGTGPAAEALDLLGLKADDLINKLPTEQLKEIGDRINAIKNPALKTAEAIAIFGKSGKDLLPLFADGEALDNATKSLGRQSQILRDNSQQFDKISDRMRRIGSLKLQGFFVGAATSLLPTVDAFTQKLDAIDLTGKGGEFGKKMQEAGERFAASFGEADLFGAATKFVSKIAEGVEMIAKIAGLIGKLSNIVAPIGLGIKAAAKGVDIVKGLAVGGGVGRTPQAIERDRILDENSKKWKPPAPAAKPEPWMAENKSLTSGGLQGASMAGTSGRFIAETLGMRGMGGKITSTSSLGRGAYGQSDLLSHGERMASMNAAVASGAMSADARSNSRGTHVVHAGDRSRARNVAKEEERKQMTLEGTNANLRAILQAVQQGLDVPGGAAGG